MSNDETGANVADTDINSADVDGTNPPERDSTAAEGSGDDAARGNLDGSNAVDEPRDRALDEAGGNGSFDSSDSGDSRDTGAAHPDGSASDAGGSGQDNGLAQ
ncbi:hypothetical protein [Humibacillus xanthopallidus]|uniref:Uncharacterized protein n=1 Tax=Humibacillus xanthopallidus TaxID=412689 RepID=A0A543HJS2_9MICO|nr:hypothetical protein [Humibacillus xanthopallidus]TQM58574.1 hypothetical protein FBY41_3943 [Humibacillus xanthopallidus]